MEGNAASHVDRTTLLRLRDYFGNKKLVPAAYLFGSRSRGKFRSDSDIDVAVTLSQGLSAEQAFWETAEIKEDLEALFRPTTVDVLDFERIPCRISHEILKTGILIAQNDEDRRVQVEARRQSEYLDFLPRLKYYRREVIGIDQ